MYDQLNETCPVAQVHISFGDDVFLLTRHEDVVKVWTDPQCGVIQFVHLWDRLCKTFRKGKSL